MNEHHYAGVDVKALLSNTENEELNKAVQDVFENPIEGESPIETILRSLTVQNSSQITLRVPSSVLDFIQAQEALAREGKPFVNIEAMFTLHALQMLKEQGFPIKMTGWTADCLENPTDVLKRLQEVQANWFPPVIAISAEQATQNLLTADIRRIQERAERRADDVMLRVLLFIECGNQVAVARVMSQQRSGEAFIRPLTALIGFPVCDVGLVDPNGRDWAASYAQQVADFFSESLAFGVDVPHNTLRQRVEQALRQYKVVNLLNTDGKPHPGCFDMRSRDCVIRLNVDEWWRSLITLAPMHEQYSELAWISRDGAREVFLNFEAFRAQRKDIAPDFRIDPATAEYLRLCYDGGEGQIPEVSVTLTVEDRSLT